MTSYSRRTFLKYSAILPSTILATRIDIPGRTEFQDRVGASHPFFAKGKNRPEVIAHQGGNRLNLPLHAWTVNDIEGMQRMIALDVDGIITDFPGPLLALLERSRGFASKVSFIHTRL